jgi:hypothetical protein
MLPRKGDTHGRWTSQNQRRRLEADPIQHAVVRFRQHRVTKKRTTGWKRVKQLGDPNNIIRIALTPVLSAERAAAVMRAMATTSTGTKPESRFYELSGVLTAPCGGRMIGVNGRLGTFGRARRYQCQANRTARPRGMER